ncbi:DNA replication and repair protein RecF [Cyclobacterium xiamenense]|uniref:DNA replication and repair protein RecF n=1 Tax=Cyclobacterium xiamenense TaxID=1297121 RepID=A0A1H6X1I0_9BACT|nr:DNA replication/repair protein RecF [Cyclobacterium xiamenense]SEJ18930.1 DNA replication and repair protein RecF [Cyclobacterium xiamenense]
MHLKNLELIQFKNYEREQLEFNAEVNCFFGENGAGKTNLLDAIHYLCLTKSAFLPLDSHHIRHQGSFFTLKAVFERENKTLSVTCAFESNKKKRLEVNGKPHDRLSEHIGLLPLVMIAPDDTQIITGGSEERRKFFDGMICQTDSHYLQLLIRYQHYLKQRNALLKRLAEEKRPDRLQLSPYNHRLIQLSSEIHALRQRFLEAFNPYFLDHYAAISGARETVGIGYKSQVGEPDFDTRFEASINQDLTLKRTSMGIHKDDFVFQLNNYPIKKYGSQGQKKSFLISLKLAQFFIFKDLKGTKPILLLDDIFDKLDDQRIFHLMARVAKKEFGQLFITDARPERSKEILQTIQPAATFFTIKSGTIANREMG